MASTLAVPHAADVWHSRRSSAQWLAVIRITVGLWFTKTMVTKLSWTLAGGIIPVPVASERWVAFLPTRLAEFADGNPLGWYREFLTEVAIPNAPLVAHLTAYGEAVVGLGLVLGLFTPWAAAVGMLILFNYLLATFHTGQCQQGFHLLLLACLTAFAGGNAGRVWGLDGWWRRRRSRAARRDRSAW